MNSAREEQDVTPQANNPNALFNCKHVKAI